MNKRALVYGLAYCAVAIAFKLYILLGGYILTNFGFNFSHIVSVIFIIPFLFLAATQVRKKDLSGVMSGREAMRISLTVVAVAVVVMSIYNYVEFVWKYNEIATTYYNSDKYLEVLKKLQVQNPGKLKTEDFPAIISEQINGITPFRSTTFKLIPLLFFGFTGSFICSVFVKRQAK